MARIFEDEKVRGATVEQAVQGYESDKQLVPVCETDSDCKWQCDVAKEGGKEHETKDIKTVGEFVKYCLEPAMQEHKPETKK